MCNPYNQASIDLCMWAWSTFQFCIQMIERLALWKVVFAICAQCDTSCIECNNHAHACRSDHASILWRDCEHSRIGIGISMHRHVHRHASASASASAHMLRSWHGSVTCVQACVTVRVSVMSSRCRECNMHDSMTCDIVQQSYWYAPICNCVLHWPFASLQSAGEHACARVPSTSDSVSQTES